MATKELSPVAAAAAEEKAKLKEEKKKFRQEQKEQKKEAKKRAAEIAKQEEALGEDGGNGAVTFLATLLIVILWLAIVCVVIKMDVGGFGSSVLTPILKDVPVVNKILPSKSLPSSGENVDSESYGGYDSMDEAVAYIKQLELELEREQTASKGKDSQIDELKAEVLRLQEFEQKQSEFQRIQTEFLEQVVYSDKGPGPEEYKKFYEAANPASWEYVYRQVITQLQADQEIQDFANTYSEMKPKQAAAIFEDMTDNLDLVAKILKAMSVDDRAKIMGAMDSSVAAKLTKMMDPDS
nr:hypothetical protein [uncultured Acetatifactor sp.]